MNKWITLLCVYVVTTACTSYKKGVTTHASIQDKVDMNKLIIEHKESKVDTSVWQDKKIVITDVEFYPSNNSARQIAEANLSLPLKTTYTILSPVKRIRHVVIESLEAEQAHSNAVTSGSSIEVDKVQINEQENIKEDKRPVNGIGSLYIFGLGALASVLILLFLRKLFMK